MGELSGRSEISYGSAKWGRLSCSFVCAVHTMMFVADVSGWVLAVPITLLLV